MDETPQQEKINEPPIREEYHFGRDQSFVKVIVAIIAFAIVFGVMAYIFYDRQSNQIQSCTTEAKLCPDGSSVGRDGPNCEFIECPVVQEKKLSFSLVDGAQPNGLAWDGEKLWASSYMKSPGIYTIDPISGIMVKKCNPPIAQYNGYGGLTFDGEFLWQADSYGGGIYKIDRNDCSTKQRIPSPDKNLGDLAWDGDYLWVVGYPMLYKLDPSDGSIIDTFPLNSGGHPGNAGLTYDGEVLLISANGVIKKIDPKNGNVLGSKAVPMTRVEALAWDGDSLWTASFDSNEIRNINNFMVEFAPKELQPTNNDVPVKSPPSTQQSTASIVWTKPSSAIMVNNGESISLEWIPVGGNPNQPITFYLDSVISREIYDSISVSASDKKANFLINLPGGDYILYPVLGTQILDTSILVKVLGPKQKLDPMASWFSFDYSSDEEEIIADGLCTAIIEIEAYDQFDLPMVGKTVNLISNRSSVDKILPHASGVNEDGEMYFSVSSTAVGTSVLRAHIDGVFFDEELTLFVYDPQEEDCYQ